MALILLSFLSLVALSQARVIKPFFDPRIVNGKDAELGEIPYQISLQTTYFNHFCGGSVLNDNYVITAGHCVDNIKADKIIVIAGTVNLNNPRSKHEVEKIIVHELYNASDSWKNDIALLKVKNPFVKSMYISHISLPLQNYVVKSNDVAVVSGWGILTVGGKTVYKLQKTTIYIANQDYCKNMYTYNGYHIYPTHICAYHPIIKTGSCQGDSGGPLTVGGKLVGLVSWAKDCALTTYPSVYTRVTYYLDWIKANAV